MGKPKEPRLADAVIDVELVKMEIDDFILSLRDKKGFIKKDSKSRTGRFFWSCDDDDWFYQAGHGQLKKPIEEEGMWIRKDLKKFLEYRKEDGWLFYLEKK